MAIPDTAAFAASSLIPLSINALITLLYKKIKSGLEIAQNNRQKAQQLTTIINKVTNTTLIR